MRDALLEVLADPLDGQPLALRDVQRDSDGEIIEGRLAGPGGIAYDIRDYVPRMVTTNDPEQRQTERSFAFKWHRQHSYGAEGMLDRSRDWLVARYGFESPEKMRLHMSSRQNVLDAGCGSGFSTSLWMTPDWGGSSWVGTDISAAIDVARQRLSDIPNTQFVQGDVLQPPFRSGSFDVVFAEGVLHHTPSTERAFHALVRLLKPAGEMMAYIYRRKGPVREFTDDHLRSLLSPLDPEEAWEALRPLTRLAKALAELKIEVEVPEEIELLGIPAGSQNVHRLIYWHFAKLFWNEAFSFEENLHVNFDWYHPKYAHRHSEQEVRRWCSDAKLDVVHLDVQDSGYTVRAVRS